jgi:hypothetical protein
MLGNTQRKLVLGVLIFEIPLEKGYRVRIER